MQFATVIMDNIIYIEDITRRREDMTFIFEWCKLYSPKQKIVKFHAQKQIGKSHVIDIFTSEDMENISLCIFQYLTLYYIIKCTMTRQFMIYRLIMNRFTDSWFQLLEFIDCI
jgi:hypothetical protein